MDIFNYSEEPLKCRGELLNKDLWQQFHELDTEMIITRSGRRMFPALRMNVSRLEPDAYYSVLLELSLLDAHKHKYSNSSGADGQGAWTVAGAADVQSQRCLYVHPDGPAPGRHWMYTAVSFGRLKLTNTMNAPSGQVVLASMHRYQPRLIIVRLRNHAIEIDMRSIQQLGLRGYEMLPHESVVFPETAFIAVTAYQNHRITKLKIDNNPFAKGFRENGQSMTKRKRLRPASASVKQEEKEEEKEREDEVVDVDDSLENSHIFDARIVTRTTYDNIPKDYISSTLSDSSDSSSSISSGYPSPLLEVSARTSKPSCLNCESTSVSVDHTRVFASYYHHHFPQMASPMYIYYPHYYQQSHRQLSPLVAHPMPEDLSLQNLPKKPRKLTDFSIKAITGLS